MRYNPAHIVAILMLAMGFISCERDAEELHNGSIISIDEPGTLSEVIMPNQRAHVTELTLTGRLNRDDLLYIRQMPELRYLNLEAVELPDDFLPESSFSSHENLEEVVLPSSLKTIGSSAFRWCEELQTVQLPRQLKAIEKYAFAGCKDLYGIELPGSLSYLGKYAFAGCWDLLSINIPSGLDSIADYINVPSDFGASIGRYANRINQGRIVLDGDTIQLPQNNFGHCLHGGPKGWQYQVYNANPIDGTTLELTRISPDGDENFPGNVTAKVTYKLTEDNAIDIKYSATTDKKTVINMTNHSYFNLSGNPAKAATDHILYVNADNYTPVDSTFMTTGEILPVKDTPMDFTTPKAVGQDINNYDFIQLKNGNGYDHNWVLNTNGDITKLAAKLTSPETGITLEVYTNEPGIQVYSGNFLDGTVTGKKGIVYNQRASVCLETQHYPDSPNKPEWPSVILEPGQTYNSECIFKFGVEK